MAMEVTREHVVGGLRRLGLNEQSRVIVHSSLKSFGLVKDGPQAVIRALREVCGTILMPTFSWAALYYPEGWENNPNCPATPELAEETNQKSIPYSLDLPTSPQIGMIPETLRQEPDARYSAHPIHRYTSVGPYAEQLVSSQTPSTPLEPIAELRKLDGKILLLGVGHDRNTTIHLAEREIGLRQWTYWARTKDGGLVECTNHPGCSEHFNVLESSLSEITQETMIGECRARLLPLLETVERVKAFLRKDPEAILCGECRRCQILAQDLAG